MSLRPFDWAAGASTFDAEHAPNRATSTMEWRPETRRIHMATVSVRYIVNDVDEAISFYVQHLGFTEEMHPAPTFAMLS
jgi:hypothetical protein